MLSSITDKVVSKIQQTCKYAVRFRSGGAQILLPLYHYPNSAPQAEIFFVSLLCKHTVGLTGVATGQCGYSR